MAIAAILCGVALIGVGFLGYVGTGSQHPTALIPAGIGLLLVICGLLALKESFRKHAMHAAAAIGLLGFLGNLTVFIKQVVSIMSTGKNDHPEALVAKMISCLLCLLFVGLCIRSFVNARLARKAGEIASANTEQALPRS